MRLDLISCPLFLLFASSPHLAALVTPLTLILVLQSTLRHLTLCQPSVVILALRVELVLGELCFFLLVSLAAAVVAAGCLLVAVAVVRVGRMARAQPVLAAMMS